MARTAARFTQADSVVYFVAIGKHIKIGFTTNLRQRLKAFLTSTPHVELLVAVPGDRALEKRIHESLAECCIAREMFDRDYRVLSFIRIYENDGLEKAMEFLDGTDPAARTKQKEEDRGKRVAEARQSRATKDAHFASLVDGRKNRLGW